MLSSPKGSVPPEKRGMSMIFQSYAIWPNMTVAENVAFGLKLRKLPASEVKRRLGDVLDVVQMGALADRYPAELSGGQQQRVALARAIVVEPSVLLLDEPLSNLDANLREEMRFEIRRLHEALRITTVYVTHDQAEAMVTSDRVAVMNKGRIEQVDVPYMVYSRPKTRFVAGFIGRTNFIEARRNGARWSSTALPSTRAASRTSALRRRRAHVLRPPAEPAALARAAAGRQKGRRKGQHRAAQLSGRALGLRVRARELGAAAEGGDAAFGGARRRQRTPGLPSIPSLWLPSPERLSQAEPST